VSSPLSICGTAVTVTASLNVAVTLTTSPALSVLFWIPLALVIASVLSVGAVVPPCPADLTGRLGETGDDVRHEHMAKPVVGHRGDRTNRLQLRVGDDVVTDGRLDLWSAAEQALRAAGCDEVERTDLCTFCHPELFFSHRRDRGRTGGQGVIGYVG